MCYVVSNDVTSVMYDSNVVSVGVMWRVLLLENAKLAARVGGGALLRAARMLQPRTQSRGFPSAGGFPRMKAGCLFSSRRFLPLPSSQPSKGTRRERM